MTEPSQPATSSEVDEPGSRPKQVKGGYHNIVDHARRYREQLENRPRLALPVRSFRRFKEIDGKHLALVIATNMFIAVIPLLIIGYALIVAFNPNRSFGAVVVDTFNLTGSTAQTVRDTFGNARSGRNVALTISVISLLITGLDISATVQTAYARAFRMAPAAGLQKYLRGAIWLVVLLTLSGAVLSLRYLASSLSAWYLLVFIPLYLAVQFGFFIATPRLLLQLPFAWRDLARGAAVSAVAAALVGLVSSFELKRGVSAYGHAYGGFGIALALIAYVGVLALFWVWVAAVMGAYWEHEAGSDAVSKMHERSTASGG